MKHVLLLANIDIHSEDLMVYAAAFCQKYLCKLHILKIVQRQEPILFTSAYYLDQRAIAEYNQEKETDNKATLETIAKQTKGLINTDWVSVSFKAGNTEAVIRKFISDNFIDLVIVSKKLLSKSNPFDDQIKKVLTNVVDLPLLFVPGYQTFKPIKKVNVFTTHKQEDIDHIVWLKGSFVDVKITATHIVQKQLFKPKMPKEKWLDYLQTKMKKKIDYEVIEGNVFDHLKEESIKETPRYDSFAFTTHKRNIWQRLWDPSTALNMAAQSEFPTFVFKYRTINQV